MGWRREGRPGARHMIEMLNAELELAMALCAYRSVGEITRAHVRTKGDWTRALCNTPYYRKP
jgi:(S)-2-hydroxy-acid oxidase